MRWHERKRGRLRIVSFYFFECRGIRESVPSSAGVSGFPLRWDDAQGNNLTLLLVIKWRMSSLPGTTACCRDREQSSLAATYRGKEN